MLNRSLPILGLVLLASGCKDEVWTQPNLDHCALNEGDRYCAELFPDRPFCIQGQGECAVGDRYGCLAEVRAECREPCGVLPPDQCMGSTETGTETGTEDASGSDSGSDGDTTGPMVCTGDDDCGAGGTPFCEPVSGECVACDATADPDGACVGLDPTAPLCVGGACVQCTDAAPEACVGVTPVCDDASNSCVACTEHAQCGEAACNLYTGACLPGDAVVHVGPGQDFATLTLAVASFAAGAEGTIVVHQANYDEAVTVGGGRVVAFLANAGDTPTWALIVGGSPQLTVGSDSTVLIDRLRLSGNAGDLGLLVDGGRAWVDRSRIVQNSGGGVLAQGGAELVLRNCFVGGSVTNVAALDVSEATVTVAYTTAISGFGMTAVAVRCTAGSSVGVTDSIVLVESNNAPVSCAQAVFERSASEVDILGVTNVGNFDDGSTWFASVAGGDFHLTPSGALTFADIAEWSTGDPTTDIDGDLRPTEDGTPDYAGADLVP